MTQKELRELAERNYMRLKDPKICDLKSYVKHYIQDELMVDRVKKTFPKKDISNPTQTDPLAIAVNNYFKILPLGSQSFLTYLDKNIYKELKERGEKYTQRLYLPLLKKAKEPYVKIVEARNQLAKKQGHKNFTDFHLTITAKISPKEYQFFLKNRDKVVGYCQSQIPKLKPPTWFYSQFNTPCFLCQLPTFPKIDFPNGAMDFVGKQYPILKKFQHKMKIKKENSTSTEYVKKTDSFVIRLSKKLNNRHQICSLIHELAHVIATLKNFSILLESKYQNELEATKIELKLLKKLSPELYKENLTNMLVVLYQTSFEIETYKNPDQDFPALYAKTVNQHFPLAKQTKNYTYLINENFVTHPLRNLPHAMAYVRLLAQHDIL